MSVWKPINQSEITYDSIIVHKTFNLDDSSYGQSFIQFKSGSSSEFSSNDSGSYWDANRVNFYLSGSQFHFQSTTSSLEQGKLYGEPGYSFLPYDSANKPYRNKFHSTGSTLSISQRHFGDAIRRESFKLTDNSHPSGTVIIVDDGYGNLYAPSASISSSGDSAISSSDNYVGNISYTLGVINITETGSFDSNIKYTNVGIGKDTGGIGSGSYTIQFDSTTVINSKEYVLKVARNDFNFTNNITCRKFGPSGYASSSKLNSPHLSDDILSSSLSGSWGPLMTTIGFYEQYEDGTMDTRPLFVARYPQAIMIRKDMDLIFKVRLDF